MSGRRFIATLLRHRLAVLLVVGLVSAVAAGFAARVSFDASIDIWFLEDDPDLVTYRQFLDRFEADEIAVLAVLAEDVFTPRVLAAVDRMTRAAEAVPFAFRVRSLTNVEVIEAEGDLLEIGPLIRELPATDPEAVELRRRALRQRLLVQNLVSADGKATAIVVELDHRANNFEQKVDFVGALNEIRRREMRDGLRVLLTGSPVWDDAFFRYTERDTAVMLPAMVGLVFLISFVVFRRLSAALVPLSVVLLALLWTFGLMGALGMKVNIVTTMLGPLLLAVGVADSIHVLAEYYRHLMRGQTVQQAIERGVAELLMPCLFTSATTAAGMLSLRVSDLAPVKEFGSLAAVGVVFAFVISVVFVPAVLGLVRAPDPDFVARQSRGPLRGLLLRLGRPTRGSAAAVLAVSGVVTAGALAGLGGLQVGANPMSYFRRDDPMRQETEALDRSLGGSSSIEALVEAPDQGLKEPRVLERLDKFERWLQARHPEGISSVLSVVDSLKEMNRVLHGGDAAWDRVPSTRPMAAQFYLLLEGEEDFESSVQEDYSVGRMTARVNLSAGGQIAADMETIEQKLRDDLNRDGLRVQFTGFVKLMSDMERYLLQSQRQSFLVAFCVVSAMMVLLLRSVRLGLFSLIPNLTPIVLGLGLMAAAGIPLDPGTVMIGSIALGLVVDDTVHFLVRLRRHLSKGAGVPEAIERTLSETGRPIVVTSLVLASGFSVMALASFMPNIYFGVVSAVVVMAALLGDLLMLPAALLLLRRWVERPSA
jgi:hypothetical protein